MRKKLICKLSFGAMLLGGSSEVPEATVVVTV